MVKSISCTLAGLIPASCNLLSALIKIEERISDIWILILDKWSNNKMVLPPLAAQASQTIIGLPSLVGICFNKLAMACELRSWITTSLLMSNTSWIAVVFTKDKASSPTASKEIADAFNLAKTVSFCQGLILTNNKGCSWCDAINAVASIDVEIWEAKGKLVTAFL